MPIKIDDLAQNPNLNVVKFAPKFWNKDITGSGKKTGILNENIAPSKLVKNIQAHKHNIVNHIDKAVSQLKKTTLYPICPIGKNTMEGVTGFVDIKDGTWCSYTKNGDYSFRMIPCQINVSEYITKGDDDDDDQNNSKTAGNGQQTVSKGRMASISYRVQIADDTNTVVLAYETENPLFDNDIFDPDNSNVSSMLTHRRYKPITSSDVDVISLTNYINDYDFYSELCTLSEIWQTKIAETIITAYDESLKAAAQNTAYKFDMDSVIRLISNYSVPLDQYTLLYDALKTRFNEDEMNYFTRVNINILLIDTLNSLSNTKFDALPKPPQTPTCTLDLSWTSPEQFSAITSRGPLNEVQAGAGTGKSTVIKARLDYLLWLGIPAEDIMVLSFTNAAADHIKERCPYVQSMTIAKMIDTIYTANHPTHKLSTASREHGEGSTFANSLELYKDTEPMAETFARKVTEAETKNAYSSLLRYVEDNHDEVIRLLDKVQQTTFALEIIICYLDYPNIQIPFNIKHLLIDEVQDNAVFEFIFFLKLTASLRNHLYLVGDCSQTLYEFRASDPRALNAIEASGLFSTFPLTTNYRSNQNVLHFANTLLKDIEANQYANIQLQSNKLDTPTKQSFSNAVQIKYETLARVGLVDDWLDRTLKDPDTVKWIQDKLNKNEQICFLSYQRRYALAAHKQLEKLFPNAKHVNIMPDKIYTFSYFSRYVSHCHGQMLSLPVSSPSDLLMRLRAEIVANLANCRVQQGSKTYAMAYQKINEMFTEFQLENTQLIADNLMKFKSGAITHQKLCDIIGESLIEFEIRKNAIKQTLLSQKNASRKEDTDTANFIYSTIHSAKGLEFDNVILLYPNKNNMSEEDKRMYYVGLTRAKNAELILSYDTVVHPVILSRYETAESRLMDEKDLQALTSGDPNVVNVTNVLKAGDDIGFKAG